MQFSFAWRSAAPALIMVTIAIVPFADARAGSPTEQRLASFDADPGWHGVRNRIVHPAPPIVRQRFGWSDTNFAGNQAGEIGGVVWRSATPAYYGMILDKPLTFDDPLSFSGSFALTQVNEINQWHTGSAIWIGFFNGAEQGWRPVNFLGWHLLGQRDYEWDDFVGIPVGAQPDISIGTAKYAARATGIPRGEKIVGKLVRDIDQDTVLRIIPDGQRHTWELAYDPNGGGGSGEIRFKLDDLPEQSLILGAECRGHGASFNRFGIFNEQIPGFPMTGMFDDMVINGKAYDFSEDPGWEGVGNTADFIDPVQYGVHDFGYSETHHAGGKRSGEIGGRLFGVHVDQPQIKASYGDDVGRLTLDDKLFARGKITFTTFGIDSGMMFGWYNSAGQDCCPVANFVGVSLDSYTPKGRFMTPNYGTAAKQRGEQGAPLLWFIPDGRVYDWTLTYDPAAADERGAVTFTLGDESSTLELHDGAREEGAVLDRFGIFNTQGNNAKFCVVYMDDLQYTVRVDK